MANPTMPVLAEAPAEALSGTEHTGTGIIHSAFGMGPDDTPTGFSKTMNLEENMLKLLAKMTAGLVISLNSGLNVGVYAITYPIAGTAYSYAGDATKAMAASDTTYLYLDTAGTLKTSTTGWPSGDHFKLGIVVTDVDSVTSVTDSRWVNFQVGAVANWWTYKPTADIDLDGYGLNDLGPLAAKDWSELTIASGAITPTQLLHTVDTEGDAASDDLTDITAVAGTHNRRFVMLCAENAARVVTVKSTSNITLNDGDFVMDTVNKFIMLMQDSDTTWVECFRNFHTIAQLNADLDANEKEITNIRKLNVKQGSDLTISSGAITVTHGYHRVDTEAMAATDDLETINGGSKGDFLILESVDVTRNVVFINGIDNIRLIGAITSKTLEAFRQMLLVHNGLEWIEVAPGAVSVTELVDGARGVPYPIGPIYLSGTLAVKVYEINVFCPITFMIKDVTGFANTAPSGGACIIDIRDDGASIFNDQSEMVNIADGTNSSTSAVKNHLVAAGSWLTIEVEVATAPVADATIMINGYAPLQTPP